jgi:hypothetical protein
MTMAIPARQRWILYAIALALALTAVRWAGGQDRSDARTAGAQQAPRAERPVRDTAADAAKAEAVPDVRLERLGKRAVPASAGDPFQAQSWEPPAMVIPRRNSPPRAPEAPPIPFAYVGKMIEGATTTVFLTKQGDNYMVRAGDTLDGTYRVEEVGDEALVLMYLPLRAKQILPFTATPAPGAVPRPPAKGRKPSADEDDDD